jgi:hypothetical protein
MHRSLLLLPILVVLGGCTRIPASAAPSGDGVAAPTTAAVASQIPSAPMRPTPEPLPSDLDPDLRHAIDLRRGLGLRYDLQYVLNAASDPAARTAYFDFPMYPVEEQKVGHDTELQHSIAEAIQAYAAGHVDEFGGLYIDREDMPTFVIALWTDHLDIHEAAIRSSIEDGSLLAVRKVKYSEAELRDLQDRISADWRARWIADIPAAMEHVGVDISSNIVEVGISSANPDAPGIIEAHYGAGDRLRVESDGTGQALIPWGSRSG